MIWGRVYFYGIVAVASAMAFFASPAKGYLMARVKKRSRPNMHRVQSADSLAGPLLGLPNDPEREAENAAREIREEIEDLRKRGVSVSMPTAQEFSELVEQKLGRKV
jgi:lysophospholipid acyltransferase